jgi:hypothetical protein
MDTEPDLMSSDDDAPLAKVVDLRRWREERDRRARAAGEELEPASPDRIAWPFRVLALVAGMGFAAFGGLLGSLPVLIHAGDGTLPWPTLLALVLVLFPVGVGIALFGIDLMGRGFLGRDWTTALWTRVQARLDRHLRPLPLFLGLSLLLVALGFWGGRRNASLWEPVLYWFVGFLHIVLHELGHLSAVRGVRYTPRRLVAGPLTVHWDDGRPAVSTTRDWRWLFGGNVWFSSRRRTRGRDLAVCVAGPLANLLAVGTVLAVDRVLGEAGYFGVYVRANLICAAFVLLFNLLPLPRSAEGYATDGRQILDLLRGQRIA